jgi:glutamine synthetase
MKFMRDSVVVAMVKLRECSDALERRMPADHWPLPTYADLLFSTL